jgi:hypothetical protein
MRSWDKVYAAVVESTPPPGPLPSLSQTPYMHTTSSFVNSSKHRKCVDTALKEELDSIHIEVPSYNNAYFEHLEGLKEAGAVVSRKCKKGDRLLFTEGTTGRGLLRNRRLTNHTVLGR